MVITNTKFKIEQMIGRNGNPIASQFTIETDEGVYFQSYDSIICGKTLYPQTIEGKQVRVWLDKDYWDYSVTTEKYRNQFLGETKKETEKKIRSGEYKLTRFSANYPR